MSEVLETFQGFVEIVEGDTAYLRLESEHGYTLYGQHSAAALAATDIHEGERFILRDIDDGGGAVRQKYERIPARQLSRAQLRAIEVEAQAVVGDPPDDDY